MEATVTREQLIERIKSLSEEELARVAPYLEADLSAVPHLEDLLEELRLGRLSAERDGLVEHDEVLRRAEDQLKRSS